MYKSIKKIHKSVDAIQADENGGVIYFIFRQHVSLT